MKDNKILKEPLKKRRYLVRYFTNLVPVTLFMERKRGDEEFFCPSRIRYRQLTDIGRNIATLFVTILFRILE